MNIKNILLLASALTLSLSAGAVESAVDAVKNMRVGWNLGNTLDSNSGDVKNMWIEHWTDRSPSAYETAWGQPVATRELFKMLKSAGFNAIRVPVTWYPHMEAKFVFTSDANSEWDPATDPLGTKVNPVWMARVREVVDYVIEQDMYCILNVHHDTGAASTAWLVADPAVYQRERERFESLWTQIAEEFKDYDGRLLFEGYNEMLDPYDSWCFASFGTKSQYDATVAEKAYSAINSYAQSFVNAVRATGGNNAERNLVVCTYGACDGNGSWSSHLKEPLTQLRLPADPATGHLITEVHSYPSDKTLNAGKMTVNTLLSTWTNNLLSKGAPMIVGEWSTDMTAPADNNAFARYFVERTKTKNIATFHWMGLTDGAARSVPEFSQPQLVDAIIKGYYGEGGYESALDAVIPSENSADNRVDVFLPSGAKVLSQVPRAEVSRRLPRGIYVAGGEKIIVR